MSGLKRIAVITVSLIMALSLLFSVAYIAAEAEHDCTGEECVICARIEVCVNTLRSAVFCAVFCALIISLSAGVFSALPEITERFVLPTPVGLKVKISC